MEDWIADEEAYALAYSGRLQEARRMTRIAQDLAQEHGRDERSAQYGAAAAVREALFGNAAEGRRAALAALALSKGRDVQYGAAIALALSESSSSTQRLVDDLQKRFPQDTLVRFNYLPTLRALLALKERKPASAIEFLHPAGPYELGSPVSDSVGFAGALYPVYVRGEAYLALRQGTEAVTEFQKILDHRGIVLSDPIGALASLQLARSYALSGDTAKAEAAYQDFLTLWKNADPDLSIPKQAKAEFASLH